MDDEERCPWCLTDDEMRRYHDREWGVPVHDDRIQFEYLMMEVMQCGLSWRLMIQRRAVFRRCFAGFDFDRVAGFGPADVQRILACDGMIRSPRKVAAVIHDARCFQQVRREFGSFSAYLWGFTGGRTYLYMGHQKGRIPSRNGLSDRISADLRARGFKYLGSVTVYAHLQSCGIINDHLGSCARYRQLLAVTDAVHRRPDHEG